MISSLDCNKLDCLKRYYHASRRLCCFCKYNKFTAGMTDGYKKMTKKEAERVEEEKLERTMDNLVETYK